MNGRFVQAHKLLWIRSESQFLRRERKFYDTSHRYESSLIANFTRTRIRYYLYIHVLQTRLCRINTISRHQIILFLCGRSANRFIIPHERKGSDGFTRETNRRHCENNESATMCRFIMFELWWLEIEVIWKFSLYARKIILPMYI